MLLMPSLSFSGAEAGGGAPVKYQLLPGTPDTNEGGWQNSTVRQVITAARMPNGGGTDRIRFSIQAADGEAFAVGSAYVGVKGAGTYDFATTPVQALFSGIASVTIPAGTKVWTDDIVLSLTDSDAVVVSFYNPAGASTDDLKKIASPLGGGITGAYKSGDSAASVTVSGYSAYNYGYLPDLEIWLA